MCLKNKGVNMNTEQAIKTAIEYEEKIRDLYKESIALAKDDVGKKVIEVLAKEEQEHVDYLYNRLSEWEKTGKVSTEKVKTAIPSKKAIDGSVQKLQKKMSDKDYSQDLKILEKALQMEIDTSNFYKKMVKETDAETQKMFERFIEIEEGHEAIVQAEISAITGLGFWFDVPEFNLEAG